MKLIIAVAITAILLIFIQYNILIKLKLKVKQSKSGIDIYLQQRFDLIPNLVQVVKGYMNYEKDLFENITTLREQYFQTKEISISEDLNNKINNIIITAENYPELKSSEQFLELQKKLTKIENELQAARRIYNLSVTNYNTKIHTVPFNIIAKICNFKEESLFQIDNEAKGHVSASL